MTEQLIHIKDLSFRPFITKEEIAHKVSELGQKISEDYKGERPLIIAILNGAFIFAADLMREINIECEITFVKLASYEGTNSTGNVKTMIGMDKDLSGRKVIIVEDIVDTGKTLFEFLPVLREKDPASIAIATLLFKSEELKYPLELDYIGFDIPSKFVVGYGLDYDSLGRELDAIYQLAE